jgi:hypothetical protein
MADQQPSKRPTDFSPRVDVDQTSSGTNIGYVAGNVNLGGGNNNLPSTEEKRGCIDLGNPTTLVAIATIVAAVIGGICLLISVIIPYLLDLDSANQPALVLSSPTTVVAANVTDTPTATETPTVTATATETSTATLTETPILTLTLTDTPTATSTYTLTPSETLEPTYASTPTSTPTNTASSTPSHTPVQLTEPRAYPCEATIIQSDSDVINVVRVRASERAPFGSPVIPNMNVTVLSETTLGIDIWYQISYTNSQLEGWIPAEYVTLSPSCP